MATTLFALLVDDGDEDVLLDAFDAVANVGVTDDQWEWLEWVDYKGRIFLVVRGSLAARGAFTDARGLAPVRLSVAHRYAFDNRSTWNEPKNSTDGRDRFDAWMSDSGIDVLDREVIEAALPKATAAPSGPLTIRGRGRLGTKAEAAPAVPESGPPVQHGKHKRGSGHTSSGQPPRGSSGYGQTQRPAASPVARNAVTDAFAKAMADAAGGDGKGFSLYKDSASG